MKRDKSNSIESSFSRICLLSVTFLLLFTNALTAQVTSSIDSTKIKIGEEIKYEIQVEADTTQVVVFPEGQTFLPLEVIESYKIDTTKKDARYKLIKKYGLTQFDSGAYIIPKQKILVGEKLFFTDSLRVEVNNVEVDTSKQKLYDIKPIIEVDKRGGNWWKYLLLTLLIIGLVAFLLYWFIWRQKPLTEEEKEALLPPYDRAKLAIQKLEDSNYLENSEIKRFYSELTLIIRKFLDEKVYDHALESTTDQLIDRLNLLKDGNQFDFSNNTIKNIDTILKRADLVKFAKSTPDIELAKIDLSTVAKEVDEVKAVLPEPTEEEKLLDQQYREAQERKKKRKKILITTLISLFLLVATFVGFGIKYGFEYVKDTVIGHESKELLEGDWVKSEYGFPPIAIETPKVLKRMEAPLPPEMKDKVKIAMFGYGSLIDQFNIVVATTRINQPASKDEQEQQQEIDLSLAIEGSLQTWESNGVKNIITKNDKFVTPNGAEGLRTHGTAEFPTVIPDDFNEGSYTMLTFSNENVIQQIVLVWKKDDVYADKMIERIIDSIELQNKQPEKEQKEDE
ncbi:hypothetical protein [Winogradskyella sp. 3972H.M.0a.05]|uniref:hypothetical protein n=1 Tax=Winogradskyella sp. 3972H.M.0a.05 TaxID=2950277 RepID=UPI003394E6F2